MLIQDQHHILTRLQVYGSDHANVWPEGIHMLLSSWMHSIGAQLRQGM